MRKQRAATRSLPFQRRPKPLRIERDENEAILPGEMRGERGRKLMARREMDEAVAGIVGRAVETPRSPRRLESGLAQDFIDRLCHGSAATLAATPRRQQGDENRNAVDKRCK